MPYDRRLDPIDFRNIQSQSDDQAPSAFLQRINDLLNYD